MAQLSSVARLPLLKNGQFYPPESAVFVGDSRETAALSQPVRTRACEEVR
jgi:hypothetical protein